MTHAPAPTGAPRRLAVRLTPDGLRHVRAGHPWVFDRSIRSVSAPGEPGDLAVVFDDRRRFVAVGLWDPASPIRIRVVHQGAPTPVDDRFWADRVTAALDRRAGLDADLGTTGYRLLHGENDGVGGLVVDRYGSVGVAKLYSEAWVPHLAALAELVAAGAGLDRVVVRWSRHLRGAGERRSGWAEGSSLLGPAVQAPVAFSESGFGLLADVQRGHKTGHFLDQRDNRRLVGSVAGGADVLDVFACTGGFSLAAAGGGARSVLSVDISEPALGAAVANLQRNHDVAAVAGCRHEVRLGDAFEVMDDLVRAGRRFGLVVVDPPSFAARADRVPQALRAYRRLAGLALDLVEPGGLVFLASCSSRVGADEFFDLVDGVATDRRVDLQIRARTGHAVDHPVTFPEGAYLKGVLARVPGARSAKIGR